MIVDIFTLCSFARIEEGGRLYIASTWATLHADKAPFVRGTIVFAFRVRFESHEDGDHQIRVTIVDGDGRAIKQPIRLPLKSTMEEGQRYYFVPCVGNFTNVRFKAFGEYRVDLWIDEQLVAESPLFFRPTPVS